ncbi:MAG: DEAD/DEAH box helicase family protein, partial [Desulforhabdus sp.]|nr:DEAD/DEAH box helicase family protein [Desulforhabdus sp.]
MTTYPTQQDLFPEEISLPHLWLEKKFSNVGSIICKVREGTQFTYSISKAIPRRRNNPAKEYESQGGVRLLITSTPNDKKLSGYNGILLRTNAEECWLHHDDKDFFETELFGDAASKVRDEIRDSWVNQFKFKDAASSPDQKGLRLPQLGALYATLAHWSLHAEPATIVMPTGTGKTETMLSLMMTAQPKCALVVVPSKALRAQIANKFVTLGILKKHEIVTDNARNPVVGVLEHELRGHGDLEIFDRCNVVVAVVNSVAGGNSVPFIEDIAERCSHLFFDEAHHVPAASWARLKEAFKRRKVLQFTATPFREDRSPIGGKVIYNYPLCVAQKEGYFKPISFKGIFEIDQKQADLKIAQKAVEQLRKDLEQGYNHRLLARCKSIDRATEVLKIYKDKAADLNPTIVHSKATDSASRIEALRVGNYKIVVTVDMLKEGFDMPELKVAAIHDNFKSLSVTLQFAGRFPRVGDESVGTPTVVANTGLDEIKSSLQGLYDEDPDWNQLLSDLSFEKVAEHERFEEFLHSSQDLSDGEISEGSIAARLNKNTLVYKFNTVAYRNAKTFNQFGIQDGLENKHRFVRAWENRNKNVVFFVTRFVDSPDWTKNRNIKDSVLNLFVVYHDMEREFLFIGSSFKSATGHQKLAQAVSGEVIRRFQDEEPYRVFNGIDHLVLHQVGLLSGGGARNVRYSMFSGADVKDAIARILSNQSQKSNIYGVGFRNGRPVDLGCSRKGKIWCHERGSLNQWTEWCDNIGTLLSNTNFNTSSLINDVLIPEPI